MVHISKESPQRNRDAVYDPDTILDADTQQAISASVMLPSKVVEPTRINTPPQQGSTAPDDGTRIHFGEENLEQTKHQTTTERQEKGVPFKEQVIGYAQKTRGTILRDSDLKEHGAQILEGQTTHKQDRDRS